MWCLRVVKTMGKLAEETNMVNDRDNEIKMLKK